MSDIQAKLDRSITRIVEAVDRSSSVSVSVQLRGAFEFGIASGDLPAGARLPSVRALAARVQVSPVTVSSVYAALQEAGHIEGRVGSGTFVANRSSQVSARQMRELEDRIDDLVRLGQECGLSLADLALRVSMATPRKRRPLRLLMLGNFPKATEAYAAALRPQLPEGDEIVAAVLPDVQAAPPEGIDLVIAPRTLMQAAEEIFADVPICGLTLIPDEATRVGLASLPTEAHILGYSYFPEFVTLMKAGIRRFAPHVPDVTMVVRGEPEVDDALSQASVVVYATGAEYLRESLRPGQTAFEYRHTPDNQAVRLELLPAIEACRLRRADKKED